LPQQDPCTSNAFLFSTFKATSNFHGEPYQRHIKELACPTLPSILLQQKLQLIQCNWGFNDTASKGLFMGYKSFFMNVEMYSNTLDLDYKSYSGLAVDGTWFKNI
jgi:hypothetical protein